MGVLLLAFGLAWAAALRPESYAPSAYAMLWPEGAPDAAGVLPEDRPELEVYLPPKGTANGAAAIICPGGGYGVLVVPSEGADIARWLNETGVTAFVLKYRLSPRYHYPAAIEDAQRAIRWVRYNKDRFGLSANRIGIVGFSAGGHLAALAAAMPDAKVKSPDEVDAVSPRPDFAVLGYAMLSLDPPPYESLARNFLGPLDSHKLRHDLSLVNLVKPGMPPFFIFHTRPDKTLPIATTEHFVDALRKAHVPVEYWEFDEGEHGVGLADGRDGKPYLPAVSLWTLNADKWLLSRGMLTPQGAR